MYSATFSSTVRNSDKLGAKRRVGSTAVVIRQLTNVTQWQTLKRAQTRDLARKQELCPLKKNRKPRTQIISDSERGFGI
jgi:hypothetical protein